MRPPHTLTIGPTGCGKTTLQTWLSRDIFRQRGGGNLVGAPSRDPRWACNFYTSSSDQLLAVADKVSHYNIWVDEMSQMIERGNANHLRLATDMRGLPRCHAVHFIGQYLKQVEPTIRSNIGRFYLFFCTVGLRDLIMETGDANLEHAASLKSGEFLIKDVMGPCRRGIIEDAARGKIRIFQPMQQKIRI